MAVYELTCILDPGLKSKKKLVEKIESWFKEVGAKVKKKEAWGKKELAYPIKKNTQGDYLFWMLEADSSKIGGLPSKIGLEAKILRYLLIKTD